jgi:hypothetical protein
MRGTGDSKKTLFAFPHTIWRSFSPSTSLSNSDSTHNTLVVDAA